MAISDDARLYANDAPIRQPLAMKAATKARFFAEHPRCCFCGGVSTATTIDHQPGRVFFINKRMPDDTLYPACHRCQDVSRDAEHLMSLLVTRYDLSIEDFQRWQQRHRSIVQKYPEFVRDLIPSPELAADLRNQIHSPPPHFNPDDMITLDAERWGPVFSLFAKKLTLAMHYRAVGRPLSTTGRLVALLAPNGHYDPSWDAQIKEVTSSGPASLHGTESLTDQIDVRWTYNQDQAAFCGRMRLQHSLIVYGFTTEIVDARPLAEIAHKLDGPFAWYEPAIVSEDYDGLFGLKRNG